jgi:hypothetical protein
MSLCSLERISKIGVVGYTFRAAAGVADKSVGAARGNAGTLTDVAAGDLAATSRSGVREES